MLPTELYLQDELYRRYPPTTRYTGWRGLHMSEGGRVVAYPGAPAVIPPIETYALAMTRGIQLMSFALMLHLNPLITAKKWHALHGSAVAMNNGKQNGYNNDIPHVDFVSGIDVGASLPRYDKMQRTFQGTFITGTLEGDRIVCRPGVDGIDAMQPLPDVETIVRKNWYVVAVTAGDVIYNFPQGLGAWVVYPFIFSKPISFEARYFQHWDRDYLPDPLKVYGG